MPLNLNEHFLLKEGADETGVPFPFLDATVWVKRANNPGFLKGLAQARLRFAAIVDPEDLTPEQDRKVTIELMAEHILVNWENIQVDGETIPYSIENAQMVLERFVLFREQVSRWAGDIQNFREVAVEAAGKDSSDDSDGS
jgi:hypothetical protein